jgi:predicted TPR repeat methyltransferase
VARHQRGQVAEAAALYREILDANPKHVDALHFLGVAEHQLGHSQVALEYLGRAIALAPDHPDAFNNRGNVWKSLGELDKAEADYRRAIELRPGDASALNNVGSILHERGDLEGAQQPLRQALALDPRQSGAYSNLGKVLKKLGRVEEAVEIYRQWLVAFPDEPRALHLLASCTGQDAPARAADGYVRAVFDQFAETFDSTLERLEYRAPTLVNEEVARLCGDAAPTLAVLDAGCGTGLCGPLLRPRARFLAGVDLSAGMVDVARKRGIYDALVVAELTEYLRGHPGCSDLIVSADTLVYFGELTDVMQAAAQALRPKGVLVFTVEQAMDADADAGYRLNLHGRYSHTPAYLLRTIVEAGLETPVLREVVLRKEAGVPVSGYLVSARRTSA